MNQAHHRTDDTDSWRITAHAIINFSRGKIIGYRLTDPEIVQDPVIFVPLTDDDRKELAGVLGVEDPAVLGMVLDVG